MIQRLVAVLSVAAGLAQAQAAFEVASIKPNNSGERWETLSPISGGRFTVKNATVAWLVTNAYRLQPFQVSGLPAWANSERFDVLAKAGDSAATVEQIRPMLQSLLADRFQMTIHRETRDLPIFAMTTAKNGPKLTKAKTGDCKDPTRSPCGGFRIFKRSQMWGNTVTVKQFASELTFMMQRMVVDKTDIQGLYDIRVEWTPEHFGPEPGTEVKPDEASPTLFTAMQEQLGLKLQSEKGPVEVLVVDKVARPTGN